MSDWSTKKILVCGRFDSEQFYALKGEAAGLGFEVEQTDSMPDESLLKEASALLIRSTTKVNEAFLKQAPNLKLIVTGTSGFDHIDFEASKNANVKLMYTPDANAQSAAELTWGLVMSAVKKLFTAQQQVRSGAWDRQKLRGNTLAGKTYGVIGLGRIGKKVAQFAKAFDMDVVACDPYLEEEDFSSIERVGLDELLKRVDIFSIHVPYTPETHNMLHRIYLENLNPGTILINTSRGQIIKEEEIIYALDQGWLGAVGLDVYDKEPLDRQSHLLGRPNIAMSPHIGATTIEALRDSSAMAASKCLEFIKSGSLSDELPPKALWFHTPLGKSSSRG